MDLFRGMDSDSELRQQLHTSPGYYRLGKVRETTCVAAPAQPRCFWNGEVGHGELASQRKTIRLDRVVHTCNPIIWEVEAEKNQEFRTSLGSIVSCRAPWALGDLSEQSPVSEVVQRRCILYRNRTAKLERNPFPPPSFCFACGCAWRKCLIARQ